MSAVTCTEWSCEWSAVDAVIAELQAAGLKVSGDLAPADAAAARHFTVRPQSKPAQEQVLLGFAPGADARAEVLLVSSFLGGSRALKQETTATTLVACALRSAGARESAPLDLPGFAIGRQPQPGVLSEILAGVRTVLRHDLLPGLAYLLAYLLGFRLASECTSHDGPPSEALQALRMLMGVALALAAWWVMQKVSKDAPSRAPHALGRPLLRLPERQL